jgi:hypothetical protein
MSGTKDDLALAVMDGYRYRHGQEIKSAVRDNIKKKREGEDYVEDTAVTKKRQKRMKEVYLVNKVKYHCEVSKEELQHDLRVDDLDETAHRIIQFKIRYRYLVNVLAPSSALRFWVVR